MIFKIEIQKTENQIIEKSPGIRKPKGPKQDSQTRQRPPMSEGELYLFFIFFIFFIFVIFIFYGHYRQY